MWRSGDVCSYDQCDEGAKKRSYIILICCTYIYQDRIHFNAYIHEAILWAHFASVPLLAAGLGLEILV
jgi:hypothetical protein